MIDWNLLVKSFLVKGQVIYSGIFKLILTERLIQVLAVQEHNGCARANIRQNNVNIVLSILFVCC